MIALANQYAGVARRNPAGIMVRYAICRLRKSNDYMAKGYAACRTGGLDDCTDAAWSKRFWSSRFVQIPNGV